MTELQQDILEERCNIQERILIELYNDLEYFTKMEQTKHFEHMQNKLAYARKKAERMRNKLQQVMKLQNKCNNDFYP